MRIRLGNIVLLVAAATSLSGCHVFGGARWHSCLNDDTVYTKATSIPDLKTPAGVDPPDTKSALKIPALNEPAPPPHGSKDPCLDEPPKYLDPNKGPKPAPAA